MLSICDRLAIRPWCDFLRIGELAPLWRGRSGSVRYPIGLGGRFNRPQTQGMGHRVAELCAV